MKCHVCREEKDTRPYGPKGEPVCFACAFATPKAKAETEATFGQQLAACGDVVVAGGANGPYPYSPRRN
jgi:hypothetical protein